LSEQQSIGQIAVQLPGATAIFRRLKLDFCCGGQTRLAVAAAEKGLDIQAVMAE
jgi:regulator of cell morphogenesis and NO signaling